MASACGSDPDIASVEGGDTLSQDDVEDLLDDGSGEVSTDGDAATVGDASISGLDVAEFVDSSSPGTIDKAEAAEVITTWIINELWFSAVAEGGFVDVQPYLDQSRSDLEEIALTNPDVPGLDTAFGFEIIRTSALASLVTDYMIEVEGIEIQWPRQLCSSHILLETEDEALAVIDRLSEGEDFAALAMELSTGPSGPSGGDLGCVDPASFVSEFVEGAAALGGPGFTPPVESQFGFHVINVHSFDATPSDDPSVIQAAVLSSPEFTVFQDGVIAREVTVDPRFGVWDPDSFSVVAANG
jgi:parvulin-like peptidyl-prolyl isomerase